MDTTVFYERRSRNVAIEFKDRRMALRRKQPKTVSREQRRMAAHIRRHHRESIKIPVRIRIPGREVSGYTHDISVDGLRVFTDTVLSENTPMTLQFSFGEHVCQLNISGQVVSCRLSKNGEAPQGAIGIKFSTIHDFEQKMIVAAIQGLQQNSAAPEKSSLNIFVTEEAQLLKNPDIANSTGSFGLAKTKEKHDVQMFVTPGSLSQMESLKTFFDRRKFELPVSFSTRRKEHRRKNSVPVAEERRLQEEEQGPLIALKMKIASLKTTPRESIKQILGEISGIDPSTVKESTKIRSLGLDSFQMIEMLAAVETVYDITLDEGAILKIVTLKDIIDLIESCVG